MKKRRIQDNTLIISDDSGTEFLSINEERDEDQLIISVSGSIKNEAAFDFEDELIGALSVFRSIVVDFSGVSYIGGAALNSLMAAKRITDENGGEMILRKVSPEIMQVIESGLVDILIIEDN
jgi:anti-anti-sigma factor